jgi:hypothetical protein
MSSNTCNINTFILIVLVILIITYTDNIFINLPVLKKLFTDSLNYILLIVLIFLIIMIDMPSGIILAFVILYLSVYVNYNNKKVKFNDVNTSINTENQSNQQYQTHQPYQTQQSFDNILTNTLTPPLSESEFIYNNTKPFPNKNIFPFEPVPQEDINKMSSNQEGCGLKESFDPDYITRVGLPSRDGFDITGCRYDFKNSPQNTTKYGPPLAQCSTYSGEQAKTCGTVFYPLNA